MDYYLCDIIDEEKIDEIMDYFQNDAESDSLEQAEKELGEEYSPEEVRLVRIKFLSDIGN